MRQARPLAIVLLLAPVPALAGERGAAQQAADEASQAAAHGAPRHRLLPFRAEEARKRGYALPPPFGANLLYIRNADDLASSDLSVALAKGSAPAQGATLTAVPFVTTDRLRGRNRGVQFRADLWLLPNLNLFATIGHMQGTVDVGVDVDLSQLVPAPLCRDGRCDHRLNFKADVDNTVTTLGAIAVYGGRRWFGSAMLSRTISVSSKDRSDVSSLNAGFRLGPRFGPGSRAELTTYVGAEYLDLNTEIEGTVVADGVFADGEALGLRYRTKLWNPKKWSALMGFSLQLARHWTLQAEYQRGTGTSRGVLSAGFRF